MLLVSPTPGEERRGRGPAQPRGSPLPSNCPRSPSGLRPEATPSRIRPVTQGQEGGEGCLQEPGRDLQHREGAGGINPR